VAKNASRDNRKRIPVDRKSKRFFLRKLIMLIDLKCAFQPECIVFYGELLLSAGDLRIVTKLGSGIPANTKFFL
jgi:hypothetical protein